MNIDKGFNKKNIELFSFLIVYIFLFTFAEVMNDNPIALISAFCGITYTILAGKGIPACYIIGVTGSALYSYLSFHNALWGNLLLYAGYYVPMQIVGFFMWNRNLKEKKNEIIKTSLLAKEKRILFFVFSVITIIFISFLIYLGDKSPVIDGITTVFSILGMYLTVKRCCEQWLVWIFVNGLSFLMWLKIAMTGVKVYSTVFMWFVYFVLAIYFYITWKKEINEKNNKE